MDAAGGCDQWGKRDACSLMDAATSGGRAESENNEEVFHLVDYPMTPKEAIEILPEAQQERIRKLYTGTN